MQSTNSKNINHHIMKTIQQVIFLIFFIGSTSSCIKEKYDNPPTGGTDPDVEVNFTIKQLKNMYSGTIMRITDSLIISGVVTADDKSGNFYKTIVIQDSTGGIAVKVDLSSAYTDFPVGRRVFIKLAGLYLGEYAAQIQLGGYIDVDGTLAEIPSATLEKYILKGKWGIEVAPLVVTISQLSATDKNMQNRLIKIEDVEFSSTDAGKPYADGVNKTSANRTIRNCNGGTIILRSSGYSNFANQSTPTGHGSITAIYSVYNTTGQLYIRNRNDIKMDSVRCGGGTPTTTNGIAGIRALYSGSDLTLPSGKTLRGVVISDKSAANTDTKNMVVQDSTGGIVVRFTANHSYNLGDSVLVDLSGYTLSEYNGLMQVTNVTSSAVTVLGTGLTITPRTVTVAQSNANSEAWESTLLRITGVTISGSGTTYNGSKTITDGSGNLTLYTRSQATFSSATYPTGSVTIVGIMSQFTSPQLTIRNTSDVQ
jgi:hypothetical protein